MVLFIKISFQTIPAEHEFYMQTQIVIDTLNLSSTHIFNVVKQVISIVV